MKKKSLLVLILSAMLVFSGCGGGNAGQEGGGDAGSGSAESTESEDKNADNQYQIALITSFNGSIDDRSFTQGSWEGIQKFGDEKGKTYQYYRATDESIDGYLNAIQMAVDSGAESVVCPGYQFEEAIFRAQDQYPDVSFILLDGTPHNNDYSEYKTADNTYSCLFAEHQAGFLAGYAIVMDGQKDLGFLGGMKMPSVVRFGYGFAQGADYAAQKLGLSKGDVSMKFGYTGNFESSPENQTKAASWYRDGVSTIFSCGGNIIYSVTAAAEAADGDVKVIGVDVDQSGESETVVTSAMKMLSTAIYDALTEKEAGNFPGGENEVLGIAENAVGLPDDFTRFETFTKEDYDEVYQELVEDKDGLLSGMLSDTDEDGQEIPLDQIQAGLEIVEVQEIE